MRGESTHGLEVQTSDIVVKEVECKPSHMDPSFRKSASESKLRSFRIPINEHLPLVESDDEISIRSSEEVLHRLVALWAVVGKAMLRDKSESFEYIGRHGLQSWLSERELRFILDSQPSERDYVQFSWRLEALFMVAWCAGLIDASDIPTKESSVESILPFFPNINELPDRLRGRLRIREKAEILDRADLLYRLHWAVRNAQLTGEAGPTGVNGGVVQEWHHAVNWMIRYNGEDNWDHVGTDT